MKFSDFCESDIDNNSQNFNYANNKQFGNNYNNLNQNSENLQKNSQNNQNFYPKNNNFENSELESNIKNQLSKYQNMNEGELKTELLKEVAKQKQSGNFSPQKLDEIKNVIFPMLDESQKNKLNDIIKMLR